jgi:hypothetical protein
MQIEQIENRKREYTDKYVMVDASRPELARFRDVVGQVKTVNMSGRALVEFMDYHLNVGWYDIDPEFLKVVDKPPPKVEKPAAKKPAAKAEAAPAAAKAPAKSKPVAPAKAGGKPSVADILAAARAGKGGATTAKSQAESTPATPKTDAAPPPAKPAAAKVDRSKMSVADMIAAARAGGAPGTAAAPAAPKPPLGRELGAERQAKATPAAEESPADEEPPVEEPAVEAPPAAKPVAKSSEKIDKSTMSIDDILAWCRQHDAK